MYKHTELMFLYCESPLHAGAGAGIGAIDLPIQRERATGYPTIHGSAIKGAMRSVMPNDPKADKAAFDKTEAVFGPSLKEGGNGTLENAGMIVVGDAAVIAFPVRSLKGVFAWVTCVDILARLHRDLKQLQATFRGFSLPPVLTDSYAYVVKGGDNTQNYTSPYNPVLTYLNNNRVYLEEYDFTVNETTTANAIADWLATNALPSTATHWQTRMKHSLVILSDEAFRDFAQYSTDVVTRNALIPETKTVKPGALWTEESLPAETLLYTPIRYTDQRVKGTATVTPADAVKHVKTYLPGNRFQLGGNETVGQGMVALRWF